MVRKSSLFILNWKDSLSINVAYNDEIGVFLIVNNSMLMWDKKYGREGEDSNIPYDFEILEVFFKSYVIEINWIDCNYTWGWYDGETDRWTGAVRKVKLNNF